MEEFLRGLPKAELHLHIEGTLEPELAFALARRNGVALPFASVEELRAAYDFDDLQSFLDLYHGCAEVLLTEQDFHDLTAAYLERAAADGVRRAEIFFDPQVHTDRGVSFQVVLDGITSALEEGEERFGVSCGLILCFLRHLPADAAMATLEEALPHADRLLGVGLDSGEVGNPPERFTEVFDRARDAGLRVVAHAGEEGPPDYVWQALDLLGAERIDHGVRAVEDAALVDRLVGDEIPLTVCPLSNVRLRVFDRLEDHALGRLLAAGAKVTINSDDPAYFGGYVGDNYVETRRALGLDRDDLVQIARNSLEATFLPEPDRRRLVDELDRHVAEHEHPAR
ncbi:MAG: adenosine deaminase [Nitriliruptorales bacterium]